MLELKTSVKNVLQNITFATSLEMQFICDLVQGRGQPSEQSESNGSNLIITGGELFNKGAQAMTFTVVDQMARKHPEKEIYLFSTQDFHRDKDEKDNYRFNILPWGVPNRLKTLPGPDFEDKSIDNSDRINTKIKDVVSDCAFIIDISGYAFSSQWGLNGSISYLSNIIIANRHSIPVYILPQSIGPFNYSVPQKWVLNPFMNIYLPYPEIISPREQDGVKELAPYTRHNVQQEFDLVLQNQDYELQNIFNEVPDMVEVDVEQESIGIVPNSRVLERSEEEDFYQLYEIMIDQALNMGRNIYILRHAVEDLDICRQIANRFSREEKVHLLERDFNPIELEDIISQFDFIIGSRYHSIVHAYKNDIPVIAIGWAIKYQELLLEFDQQDYFFDGRQNIGYNAVIEALEKMDALHIRESNQISQRREEILEEDSFGTLLP